LNGGTALVAATVLSFPDQAISLEPADGPHPILRLAFESTVSFGCGDCTLSFDDGLILGAPPFNTVSVVGESFRPARSGPVTISNCCETRSLAYDGLQLSAVLTPQAPALCVSVAPHPGEILSKAVLITLEDPAAGDGNALYARWFEGPTAALFDAAALVRFRPGQRIVIPYARIAPLKILVEANVFADPLAGNTVALAAELVDIALTEMTPAVTAPAVIHASVFGGRFEAGTSLLLTSPEGIGFVAVAPRVVWPDRIDVVFDLRDAPPGEYALVANRGGAEAVLEKALLVIPRRRGKGRFEVTLEVPPFYRNGELSRMVLGYGNTGDEPIEAAPFLQVTGPEAANVQFSLIGDGDRTHAKKLQLLAVNQGMELNIGNLVIFPEIPIRD
jgi:hypothetical protein